MTLDVSAVSVTAKIPMVAYFHGLLMAPPFTCRHLDRRTAADIRGFPCGVAALTGRSSGAFVGRRPTPRFAREYATMTPGIDLAPGRPRHEILHHPRAADR